MRNTSSSRVWQYNKTILVWKKLNGLERLEKSSFSRKARSALIFLLGLLHVQCTQAEQSAPEWSRVVTSSSSSWAIRWSGTSISYRSSLRCLQRKRRLPDCLSEHQRSRRLTGVNSMRVSPIVRASERGVWIRQESSPSSRRKVQQHWATGSRHLSQLYNGRSPAGRMWPPNHEPRVFITSLCSRLVPFLTRKRAYPICGRKNAH